MPIPLFNIDEICMSQSVTSKYGETA